MDRKTFSIGILSLTALILFIACLIPAKPAQGEFAVKDSASRLQLVTVTSQKGGNALYLIDPVGGKILVLGYDANTKDLRAIAATTLDKVFP